MTYTLEGVVPYLPVDVEKYVKSNWWRGLTMGDLLDRAADMHPDKEALVDSQNRYTYGEVREKTNRLALGLMKLGIKSLDRVMIQLPNWAEFVFVYFACQKIGAVTVLLIDRYRQFEIDHLVKITEPTAWIVPTKFRKTDFEPIVKDVLSDHPGIENIITVRGEWEGALFSSLETLISETEQPPAKAGGLE